MDAVLDCLGCRGDRPHTDGPDAVLTCCVCGTQTYAYEVTA